MTLQRYRDRQVLQKHSTGIHRMTQEIYTKSKQKRRRASMKTESLKLHDFIDGLNNPVFNLFY